MIEQQSSGPGYWIDLDETGLVIGLQGERLKELQMLLSRALNCLEPRNTPSWALELADALDAG